MPTCQHCYAKWSWRETFCKMFTFKNKLKCSSCETFQYISKKSRNQISLLSVMPCLSSIPLLSFNLPIKIIVSLQFITMVLALIWMPFLYKLNNKDGPMW
ncbi:TIGR04104 family putative zinc finger protein [Peribacillus asahii]|uniref:TIGR04104 family putative zinc finger protein n=1 Tax=Peribacillus asahii TaxID=228899 RepID=UPI0037F4AF6C